MQPIIITIGVLLSISACVSGVSDKVYYNDQKLNCSKNIEGNFCYNGPLFDAVGQYKSCVVAGVIALTFDDGPTEYSGRILDLLKTHQIKATFNLIGKKIRQYHDIVQRMVDEGHQIASHTQNHVWLNEDNTVAEMLAFEVALVRENFTGPLCNSSIPVFMRSPHGVISRDTFHLLKNQLGYVPIHWGMLTHDSLGDTDAGDVVQNYYSHFGGPNGDNVLFDQLKIITQQHDSQLITVNALEELMDYFEDVFISHGVRFVTMSECLGQEFPMYRPNPRLQNDPNCLNGIPSENVCCPKSCGECGGEWCSQLKGGGDNCCVNTIQEANYSCSLSPAPCVIPNIPDPKCALGILRNNVCCHHSCGTECGGVNCGLRDGGYKYCCGSQITRDNRPCGNNSAPCVLIPYGGSPSGSDFDDEKDIPDPTCLNGTKNGDICCAQSCGTCGGVNCSQRPGGASFCCPQGVLKLNRSCNEFPAPCQIREVDQPDQPNQSDQKDKKTLIIIIASSIAATIILLIIIVIVVVLIRNRIHRKNEQSTAEPTGPAVPAVSQP